jgi:hypothetical protein
LGFLGKVRPFIQTDDPIVLNFILRGLEDVHRIVPAEWTEILLKNVQETNRNEEIIFSSLLKFPLTDRAVVLLVEGYMKAPTSIKPLYLMVMENLEPELALRHQSRLADHIDLSKWTFYELLTSGTEDELRKEYSRVLDLLDKELYFNASLYTQAKQLAKAMIGRGWVSEQEIGRTLHEQLQDDYFSFKGILAVYMIGLLEIDSFIPLLVTLLDRDEDILLEETTDSLISFQSDEIVKLVSSYARLEASSIFAIAVLSGTKTPLAVRVLQELLGELDNEDDQSLAFEGLCQQLTAEAIPSVDRYLQSNPTSYLVALEETAYSFYKVMGVEHPNLQVWREIAEAKEKGQQEAPEFISLSEADLANVGRNELCPCGSGRKFKKCCGA